MMTFKNLFLTATILLGVSPLASAQGGRDGGGGVVFVCQEFGKQKVYLADSYKLIHSMTASQKEQLASLSEKSALRAILKNYGHIASDKTAIKQNILNLNFETINSGQHLSLLGDDDIKVVPPGCEKRQLAVQSFVDQTSAQLYAGADRLHAAGLYEATWNRHDDLSDPGGVRQNTVYYDRTLFYELSPAEMALFRFHEALVKKSGTNSLAVRSIVAKMASTQVFLSAAEPLYSSHPSENEQQVVVLGYECDVPVNWNRYLASFRTNQEKTKIIYGNHVRPRIGSEKVCVLYSENLNDQLEAWIFNNDEDLALSTRLGIRTLNFFLNESSSFLGPTEKSYAFGDEKILTGSRLHQFSKTSFQTQASLKLTENSEESWYHGTPLDITALNNYFVYDVRGVSFKTLFRPTQVVR